MKELTRAEEQVMQILWKLEKAFVKDVVESFNEPKPAYNTVSTIIRILEKKGFVSYEAFGKTHQYYPLLKKEQYSKQQLGSIVTDYFEGSFTKMLSFFTSNKKLSLKEIEEAGKLLKKLKSNTKK
ncbi:MAG: BlaI/MecI/CopY family transcriptional regulator [Bacteroidia bacterium]|nr:BlaI/MecI/CopY family transcriptional regulator [Bacteroidia bacterium]